MEKIYHCLNRTSSQSMIHACVFHWNHTHTIFSVIAIVVFFPQLLCQGPVPGPGTSEQGPTAPAQGPGSSAKGPQRPWNQWTRAQLLGPVDQGRGASGPGNIQIPWGLWGPSGHMGPMGPFWVCFVPPESPMGPLGGPRALGPNEDLARLSSYRIVYFSHSTRASMAFPWGHLGTL